MSADAPFDPHCTACPRLVAHRRAVQARYPDYHCAPVAAVGVPFAPLLIVGLAPGLHGANRSGLPFAGDGSGALLFDALCRHGIARWPEGADALLPDLFGCRLTNAVKCLPPGNLPSVHEIRRCGRFLARELSTVAAGGVVLALGRVAHEAVLRCLGRTLARYRFGHGAVHDLDGERTLVDSYHCSRYNIQTGRMTAAMMDDVIGLALARVRIGAG